MEQGKRRIFCVLAGLVMLTAISSLVAGGERPQVVPAHPAMAAPARLLV